VESGKVTFAELYGTPGAERPFGGGLDPKTQQKAVKAHARSTERLGGKQFRAGTGIELASNEHIARHVEMAQRIIHSVDFADVERIEKRLEEIARATLNRG